MAVNLWASCVGGLQAEAMIVCVGSDELNIYSIGDAMTKKGWSLNSLQVGASRPLITDKQVERCT